MIKQKTIHLKKLSKRNSKNSRNQIILWSIER